MTNQHPLTSEIIDEMIIGKDSLFDDDMRAAADWQLEQVINWLVEQGYSFSEIDEEGFLVFKSTLELLARLKKAMRPQENDS